MDEPRSKWDYPVTDTELDSFYGVAASKYQVDQAIGEASTKIDIVELCDAMHEYEELILDAIADQDAEALGNLVLLARRQRIAAIASRALYGKEGVIRADEVKV